MPALPDRSIRICADRGGTFCDVHASYPDPENPSERKEIVVKLLSQDPNNYADAPTEGVRRILEKVTGDKIERGTVLPVDKIDYIRLSTTVATNALLERKGAKHALLITRGLRDALIIGNQARPRIFDLNIRRPSPLFSEIVEVDERVTLVGYSSDPKADEHAVKFDDQGKVEKGYKGEEVEGEIVRGMSGEAVRILKRPDEEVIKKDLEGLYAAGYRSLAIVLAHSYTFPDHEQLVGRLAREMGFTHVSESAALLPMIRLVPRGVSSTADAYLTPVLRAYLDGFFAGFDPKLKTSKDGPRVEFMGSDGGLLDLKNFSGLKSILSGPAGGVVGYALTSWDDELRQPVIGLDVGGTSTDVSRFADGRYALTYETTTAGISVQSPQLDINTVAAGGGSCLSFKNGLFRAGPESAGAEPGPVCYRKGGPLAVTDANLVLGRLLPDYFPKIFGPSEKEPLDVDASKRAFEKLAQKINAEYGNEAGGEAKGQEEGQEGKMGLDEVVYGFIKVANETMCRPIRALTEARGFATGKHILASFGGAGGQHACEIAQLLGIKTVLVHRHSSILSAYGLALADRVYEVQQPSATTYSADTHSDEDRRRVRGELKRRLDAIEEDVKAELKRQGFEGDRVRVERALNMRFEGTDTAIMVVPKPEDGDGKDDEDFGEAFRKEYKSEYGFLLAGKNVVVDDVKVRGTGRTFDTLGPSVFQELKTLERRPTPDSKIDSRHSVYFESSSGGNSDNLNSAEKTEKVQRGRTDTPVYKLEDLEIGEELVGPAMVIDETQTIVLVPGAKAVVTRNHLVIEL